MGSTWTIVAALLLSLLGSPLTALGWGGDGHRIVGEIASGRLNDRARAQVTALLGPGGTLADACAWADEVARRDRRYAWARPLHYIDLDPAATTATLDEQSCPLGEDGRHRCIVAAIADFTATLADGSRPAEDRLDALRFLAHFVGDLHQPLHVSHADGRGGNTVFVWVHGRRTRLHTLWDSGLIEQDERVRATLTDAASPADAGDWRPLGDMLARDVSAIDTRLAARALTTAGATTIGQRAEHAALVWATESLGISKDDLLFRPPPESTVGDAALSDASALAERQLRVAGVRLAALLNAIFP